MEETYLNVIGLVQKRYTVVSKIPLLLCNLVLFSKLNFQKIIQSSVNDSFCELQNYYQSHVARFMINIHDTKGEKCVEIVKHN